MKDVGAHGGSESDVASPTGSAFFGWDRILELTEQMVRAAENSAWEDVALLEEERRKLVYTDLPPLPREPPGEAFVRRAVQRILDADQRVIVLCQVGQQDLADKIRSLRVGQRAQRAYRQAYRSE